MAGRTSTPGRNLGRVPRRRLSISKTMRVKQNSRNKELHLSWVK